MSGGVTDAGAYIISAALTGAFGIFISWQNWKLKQNSKTNHGKTLGQHVEHIAEQVEGARLQAQLVALKLEQYKQEQLAASKREHDLVEGYMTTDLAAHSELRSLIVQVAGGQFVHKLEEGGKDVN